ncbi:MAG: hypothetical protein M1282_04735, partial [Chloroflexi bacterium]|nr:hypothetical protein [Chloroflexota bacterium]
MNQKASKKYEPPKADSGDTAHLVAKAALSVVPGASELFEYFIKPPLEKRLEKWQEEVANALRHLEEENRLNIENLKANEQFISIIVQVTTIALRNHQKEKLSALKNVIINSALQTNINDDLQLI